MIKNLVVFLVTTGIAAAQVTIPDGTKIRVRLEQTISSGTADQGQAVDLSVTEAVKVGDEVVIPEGARVTGAVIKTQEKRRMGRSGKLDFSIDRVRAADGEWVPLRYTANKNNGGSHAVATGVLTAGAAVLFWPTAPAFLLIKGKDVTINKGVVFETFTDRDHVMAMSNRTAPALPGMPTVLSSARGSASISITSLTPGAEIEVDGAFVGSTPTMLTLPAGQHQITVKNGVDTWQRIIQVSGGSNVTVNAQLTNSQAVARRSR